MKINIETIPPEQGHHCGYSTCGDFWVDEKGVLQIRVTELGDDRSNWAIAVHEGTEYFDASRRGITEMDISQFDAQYEKEREAGLHKEMDEPGDDPRATYRESHMRATHVERAVCHALDLLWDQHQGDVESHVL